MGFELPPFVTTFSDAQKISFCRPSHIKIAFKETFLILNRPYNKGYVGVRGWGLVCDLVGLQ